MSEPYSRIYWHVMSDDKFDGIREDARLFGAWALLLVFADMAYPAPAYIPPIVARAAFRRLVDCGLVDDLGQHRYRVRGLEAERNRRSNAGRAGGIASGRSRSGRSTIVHAPLPIRPAEKQPSKAEQEQSKDTAGASDPADIYWQLTGKFPSDGALTWIDQLSEQYGSEAFIGALAACHIEDRSTQTLIGRTKNVLASKARQLSNQERAEEKARLAEKRAQPRVEEPWKAEFRALIEQQYREAS